MTFMSRTLATAALALIAAGAAQASEVKIAMNGADDPATNAEAAFAHGFADALDGTDFEVTIFPSGTLGSEKERFDQVAQGLVEVNLATASTSYGMSPMVKGVALPFFFESTEQFDDIVVDTDILEEMNAPLVENGVRLVGFNFIGGSIGIHNAKKPIATVEDMQDLRFRALNAEQLDFIQTLGATGTIVAWAEVANAIQTGVADGYFNAPNSAIRTGHTDFLKYYTPADISPSTRIVLISEDWYASLSDDEKAQIDTAVAAGIAANRAWVANWLPAVREKHESLGVTITEMAPGERDKMADLSKDVWAKTLTPEQLDAWTQARAAVSK
ncbi:TRAP transporter substrate-binding protein [Chachezhania sediminis]|uniref:TRAP transporter substrate-binding protein n=1 Tax=Chachezhania sediminis TaxID=2599291 RepID=UPI00131B8A94|nr:TRAP transporter substrate-binding protein [Chachezhania sediminis]